MSARRLDASALRDWAHTAVGDLITHTDEINRLNVFPVADADTGTNMLFTMRSAWAHADAQPGGDVAQVASALAAGALQGARGNSGVILSQILLGLAEVVTSAAADRGGNLLDVDGALFGAALRHAVALVAVSMGDPVPGTIVSVLQAAADSAEKSAVGGGDLAEVAASAADAAATALDHTPQQLEVLAEAGVVDSGGRGLLVLLDAMTTTITGRAPRRPAYTPAPRQAQESQPLVRSSDAAPTQVPQFEVMYLLSGCAPEAVEHLRAGLEQLGESVAIATSGGDRYSVHVHVDDAGAAVEAGLAVGTLKRIQITALTGSGGSHPSGGWERERAVLAVVDGDGGAELFAGEGAHVLRPEGDEPVSAKQLLRALVDVGAAQVMVLPNGYVAAEELVAGCTAAIGWGIDVVPVPAGSMVQGLAALAVHDAGRQAVDDGYTMARAAAGARHGSVRVATEEALTWAGACKPGDGLGIAGDEVLIVGPDVTAAAAGLIDLLLAAGGELVTVLTGHGVDPAVGAALQTHVHQKHLGAELVTYHTGHRGDALLIGVE
ncbi:DAK2 domain-containing protein [Mycolicibacterium goodii]|uniref:DAK2 domain-containing protein n=1 Tax=Mycolicibacterium goodii TaxID=134601 RepID=A0ABS6HPY9_MYCGD|nr:DAK2 domain-containing protein [Mycolicibacterium goodii]MBU8809723.1 DAK2 domain-containing protein [Mycolicibacterium goodii]MBU8816278.1 DAK2 domain-containing protein [Mycolicibacterium goodii]MBU8824757.1 DAK2 domain-containing protein [Mycolicibacterium goodii]MBU8833734.1 DAK2 domain-containing protein [Mycolicibacterium goodii]MBU8837343.1 DAK2 domain-containing protein [Mycolicibacterium goodii]